jgi:hypothetical protein
MEMRFKRTPYKVHYMKGYNPNYKIPDDEKRIRRGFLLLPKTIQHKGKRETRWLEFASWEQRFCGDGGGAMGSFWQDRKWIDN